MEPTDATRDTRDTRDPSDATEDTEAALAAMGALSPLQPQPLQPLPAPLTPVPIFLAVSGLYQYRVTPIPGPVAPVGPVGPIAPTPAIPIAKVLLRETLRLDVDGRYPQRTASGTLYQLLSERTHWVASLTKRPDGSWTGPIWYKDGDLSSFLYTSVRITAVASLFPDQRSATVVFTGPGGVSRTRTYRWESSYFRPCEIEYDTVTGANRVTEFPTGSHPTRPASLPVETITIEKVFQRAGFNVTKSGGDANIPIVKAGANQAWSDAEMHDAMQTYWSRFAHKAQWSVWTLFASLHETGTSLGGVMFDDIGPNHRQGTAVFTESFIKNPPANEPAATRAAWVQRMRFWTAVHEMGHTFNLAHSWQKAHPPSWGTPWVPLTNEPEARSFMNYPYNVAGGQSAFFGSFDYRFSDQELLFMRHAPERFVQHGNADWFDHHGFEQTRRADAPAFELTLRVNRAKAVYDFLDQPTLELKLKNVSTEPQIVDRHVLATADRLTVVVRRQGTPARQFDPYATTCWRADRQVLAPGEATYESLYAAAGLGGWYMAEPGRYLVQVALHLDGEDVVSNPLELRIRPPRGFDEEDFAQDFFTADVGRVLAFDGSRALGAAVDTLREATDRFGDAAVAVHAGVAVGLAEAPGYKELRGTDRGDLCFTVDERGGEVAVAELGRALGSEGSGAPEKVLGHIDYVGYVARLAGLLEQLGNAQHANRLRERALRETTARPDGDVRQEVYATVATRLGLELVPGAAAALPMAKPRAVAKE